MKIDLQLHEFCSVIVKATIKKQQEHTLLVCNIINKNMGLLPKLESNRSENHQKIVSVGPRVNLPRLNNILSLNISNVCHLFNVVLVNKSELSINTRFGWVKSLT